MVVPSMFGKPAFGFDPDRYITRRTKASTIAAATTSGVAPTVVRSSFSGINRETE